MKINWFETHAAVWRQQKQYLRPVAAIDPVSLESLIGIDEQKAKLVRNTERLVEGGPANNALLWGARGTGKSSLIKAVFNEYKDQGLRLIEVFKNDLHHLPEIVDEIREMPQRFVIFCDDFSFDENENSYIALKTILEGSIEQKPDNVLLYVTSNRRHLVPETMDDNLASKVVGKEIHYADAIEEKISLSDRFGLWLSFYQPSIEEYLAIVDNYFPDYSGDRQSLHKAALDFSRERAARSGRTAKQFYNAFFEN